MDLGGFSVWNLLSDGENLGDFSRYPAIEHDFSDGSPSGRTPRSNLEVDGIWRFVGSGGAYEPGYSVRSPVLGRVDVLPAAAARKAVVQSGRGYSFRTGARNLAVVRAELQGFPHLRSISRQHGISATPWDEGPLVALGAVSAWTVA